MQIFAKSGFFGTFAAGFVLGAIGLIFLQPAEARRTLTDNLQTATHLVR
jgi:hypothetical protein